jgi:type IV pilus assembly protein PilY1
MHPLRYLCHLQLICGRRTVTFRKIALSLTLLAFSHSASAAIGLSQTPLFVSESVPPLNMLVMGRDHKLYYEAYNDASDLNGDGVLDIGYRGFKPTNQGGIDYYGYFNSRACYTYQTDKFVPVSLGTGVTGKECSNAWSGDFLNYVATSRMDALRKVLYGGYRNVDSTTETVLQGAYIPQDAHTWGKEYTSIANDEYDVRKFTPLRLPSNGYRHIIAVTSLSDNGVPQLRVLQNTNLRVWNWVSIERPVAGDYCVNSNGARILCTSSGPANGWGLVPASNLNGLTITTWTKQSSLADVRPTNTGSMTQLFNSHMTSARRCGSRSINGPIYTSGGNNNPFGNARVGLLGLSTCGQDNYITEIVGKITLPVSGTYRFSVDGDDAVDVYIDDKWVAGWYGGHGSINSGSDQHAGSITLNAGTYNLKFRHEDGTGDDNWGLYWQVPSDANYASVRNDYNIRVSTCLKGDATLREENCQFYNGEYKPTGILHEYGTADRMNFGLLTGSYKNHFYGGVLRTNIQSFKREINEKTGQFCVQGNCGPGNDVAGIVESINRLRTYGFNYTYSNGSGNYQYDTDGCGYNMNPTANLANDPCYMWGTPTAEMMYEALRYFAGATGPTPSFDYSGTTPDSRLGLPKPAWAPPYVASASREAYPRCAVPVMTVISDVNPNYDWKLPGSHWTKGNPVTGEGNPLSISKLNVSAETDAIGAAEGLHGSQVFIGESGSDADSAPTQKTVGALSQIRGLAPEEPGKQGTYYSAGIARFGANNKIGGDKNLLTYAVALASPFPKIEFPVGNNKITLVPFAKSVQDPAITQYQATNQIADFYIQKLANTTDANRDTTINDGRPYAEFRINWEDSEEGADFDMDAIALYKLEVVPDEFGRLKLQVSLSSEYAAGGAKQHMGYTISGTGQATDGLYLEICDLRDGASNNGTRAVCDGQTRYRLNTPPGRPAGWCINNLSSSECEGLPPTTTRSFYAQNVGATILKDPLWYAAKYGNPSANWDSDGDGTPDNYFLVTNALTLKEQLSKAFSDIVQKNSSVTSPSVEAQRQNTASDTDTAYVYRTDFNIDGWTGDVVKEKQTLVGGAQTSTAMWSARSKLATNGSRNILIASPNTTGKLAAFTWENLKDKAFGGVGFQTALNRSGSGIVDNYGPARVKFLRGESCAGLEGCSTFRERKSKLGDIVNSSPVLVRGAKYLAYRAGRLDGGEASYASFKATQDKLPAMIYVGANDGMLHAFRAGDSDTDSAGGNEVFAFMPSAVINNLNKLTSRTYGDENGEHQYFVDGTPTVADVYFNNAWRTVLVGGLGAGGRGVYALDITVPTSPKLLWEFTSDQDQDLGFTIPKPVISRLHNGKWAALIPNGYNSATDSATLFALDIATGTQIAKLKTNATGLTSGNGLSNIRTADFNGDGIVDYVYGGDLSGNLWRFDLLDTASNTPFAATPIVEGSKFKVSFGGNPLYVAKAGNEAGSKRQPITSAPTLIRHPSGLGYLAVFGTGQYLTVADKASTDTQTLYGIWDRRTLGEAATSSLTANKTRANLQRQTMRGATFQGQAVRMLSNEQVNWYRPGASGTADTDVNVWGWYLDLQVGSSSVGERLVYNMTQYGDGLIFSTVTPNADVCAAGLTGFTYGINPTVGGRTNHSVFDLSGDGRIDSADQLNGETISGYETAAGDTTISNEYIYDPEGDRKRVDAGGNSNGRQTWQVLPANSSY